MSSMLMALHVVVCVFVHLSMFKYESVSAYSFKSE